MSDKPTATTPDRRLFLSQLFAAGVSAAALATKASQAATALAPVNVANPFAAYPSRDWEKVYRDLYKSDSTFVWLCAPNDTHNCLLNAHVKNGVVTRISPTYGYGKAKDLDGKSASHRWDPRVCQKGLAMVRRFYGDRRVRKPMIRRGFLEWAESGFPRDADGRVDPKYLQRGKDTWIAVPFERAFDIEALALKNIAETYDGKVGSDRLLAQGYDPAMVGAVGGAGVQVLKFRGGMPALGMTRIFAQYRMANCMALLDDKIRGKGRAGSIGARGWDNYSWHTDLPPGHPMVTGAQTVDFDLCNVEYAKLIIVWGMNWITTKMPDAHWLTEARLKGAKVVVIACEYSATSNKADEFVICRPGVTPAIALGVAQQILANKSYDVVNVKTKTDLPFLVRMDTAELLRMKDLDPNYKAPPPVRDVTVLKANEAAPPPVQQRGTVVTEDQLERWGTPVVWDTKRKKAVPVPRDAFGKFFTATNVDPALEGEFEVELANGAKVRVRTVFQVTKEVLDASYTPEQVEKLTWAPASAIRSLAKQIAKNRQHTLFACGMGPNQFFNSDLKDRAIFLIAALTDNVGHFGGNVGSYAGNYRAALMNGLPQYIMEDPFDAELDPQKPAREKAFYKTESVHYFNHGDTVLRSGKHLLTGKTHLPTPTKSIHVSNSNSLIGNAKGHYETVMNVLPRVDMVAINEWWWTASCEYADIVYAVDSWLEAKSPDMSISCTNPFLYTFPTTPLPRIHGTRGDTEVAAGVCRALGTLLGDDRFAKYWAFTGTEPGSRTYLQRILDKSGPTRGYRLEDLEKNAQAGIPAIVQTRTYPKVGGWEQAYEDRTWYTKSGRLEFYRDEAEFRDSGENIVVHREPIDSTFHEPNVIVSTPHPLIRPKTPQDYGVDPNDLSGDARQARHVLRTVDEVVASKHPLMAQGHRFIFHTPKYRHGTHSTPTDTDIVAVWFGPFADMRRKDPRQPFVNEAYVDINPDDAKSLGVEEGDYVTIDADPHDRPFHGWQQRPDDYKMARLVARARYYAGTPRGVTRMWHNMYGATYGSVEGQRTNPNGLAKSPHTGYQAVFRTGSHQSCTRGWLKPTWMTDSLAVKSMLTQQMAEGFVADVHCPTGAPREAFVTISKVENGGLGGKGVWGPAARGWRPTYENDDLKKFLAGKFVSRT